MMGAVLLQFTNLVLTKITWAAFRLSGLACLTSQCTGLYEFSELVLIGLVLLMDQSRSVLPLQSAKAREFRELWRKKCARAPWTFQSQQARTDNWKATVVCAFLVSFVWCKAHCMVRSARKRIS